MPRFNNRYRLEKYRTLMEQKRARNERTSGYIPYGYRVQADGHHLSPIPFEQKVIKRILRLRRRGLGCELTARKLNRDRVKARGRCWHSTTVVNVIRRHAPDLIISRARGRRTGSANGIRETAAVLKSKGIRVGDGHPRTIAYGWTVDPAGSRNLVRSQTEWPVVMKMRRMQLQGLGSCEIARRLTAAGIRARSGGWCQRNVYRVLRREFGDGK